MMNQKLSDFLENHNYIGIQMTRNIVGHFEIDGRVNGQFARLLVDTGASHTVIDSKVSKRLLLETTKSDMKGGGIGTSQHTIAHTVINRFEFADLIINEVKVAVMDLSYVNQSLVSHGGKRIDGAIGGDLMAGRGAVIDYPNAVIYLLKD